MKLPSSALPFSFLPFLARINAQLLTRVLRSRCDQDQPHHRFSRSGKTTSILHLLAHKDPNEKGRYWLMNLGKSELMVLCSPMRRTAERDPRRLHVLR